MAADIRVTIWGRGRKLPLQTWREQIDQGMQALIMRCETVSAGRVYAFECYVLIEAWHPFDAGVNFLHQLAEHNKSRGEWAKLDLPFVVDLRRES